MAFFAFLPFTFAAMKKPAAKKTSSSKKKSVPKSPPDNFARFKKASRKYEDPSEKSDEQPVKPKRYGKEEREKDPPRSDRNKRPIAADKSSSSPRKRFDPKKSAPGERNQKPKPDFSKPKSDYAKPKPDYSKPKSDFNKPKPESGHHKTEELPGGEMRLNKYLAHSGVASRRAADTLIMQGHVAVNGVVVQEMGYKVQEKDVVAFKGKPIKRVDKLVYILLNKPRNVLSTSADERGRKTVLDIIAAKIPERIYPVGRLDRNTSGLILLTNDGDLTKKLSHPSHKVPKVYQVTLDKNLSPKDLEIIREGITLEDGDIKADSLHYVEGESKREVQIEIHSGRNRIVRRIFEHLGYEVVKLDRVYYAGLTKKNLPRGFYRPLTKEEIRMLKHFV